MASSPTSVKEKGESDLSDAVNHLVNGKRQLLVSDYVSAVASLQEACQLFSKHYGETADECAEPYLYYGRALLEYSRMETGVLGNALQGVPAEEEEEEDDDEDENGEGEEKESEEGDEQVENPEKVTGEEREQIIQQVEAAIDENSRDLDIKMAELKKSQESASVTGEGTQKQAKTSQGYAKEPPKDSEESTKDKELVKNSEENTKDKELVKNSEGSTKDKELVKDFEESAKDKELVKDSEESTKDPENSKEKINDKSLASSETTKSADVEMSEVSDVNEKNGLKSAKKTDSEKDAKEPQVCSEVSGKETSSKVVSEEVKDSGNEKSTEAMKETSSEKSANKAAPKVVSELGTADETKEVVNSLVVEASKETQTDLTKDQDMETDTAQESKLKSSSIQTEQPDVIGNGDSSTSGVTEKTKEKADDMDASEDKPSSSDSEPKIDVKESAVTEGLESDKEKSAGDEEKLAEDKGKSVPAPVDEAMDSGEKSSTENAKIIVNGVNDTESLDTSDAKDVEMDEAEDNESESTGEKSQDEGGNADGEQSGPSTSTKAAKEEEDDVTNLQLAWEVLELAKVILKRQADSDKTKELKVAEVLLKLGEVSIESENYQQATDDLSECLLIQKRHLAPHDRAVAETLYQLGLAHSFNNRFEQAIENFTNSMKVIEERIAVLKQTLEDKEPSKDAKPESSKATENAKESALKEVKNITEKEDVKDSVTKDEAMDSESKDETKDSVAKCEDKNSITKDEIKGSVGKDEAKNNEKDSVAKEETKDNGTTDEGANKAEVKDSMKDEDSKEINSESAKDTENTADPWQDTKREIAELEELVPDIRAKIEDTEDLMKNTMESIKEAALQRLSEKSPEAPPKSEEKDKPVSNISHLIKRKRKPEEESAPTETNELKKPRPSEENGQKHVNGNAVLNGDSKPMETEESSKQSSTPMETSAEPETAVA